MSFNINEEMQMDSTQHTKIVNFIWGIANDVLRDVYLRGKYRDVILPMTVIRRLDLLLEPLKEKILSTKRELDSAGVVNQDAALRQSTGQAFYNISSFTLKSLLDNPKQIRSNFENYLDGYSPNVQEILDKFKFRNQIQTLVEADILFPLIEKFTEPSINLSPKPFRDNLGKILMPGLDNHGMGTVFEELLRRFNEENNEEAGEHFTPRDVVKLMANLIILPIAEKIESGTYLVYDGACGTGGMLTVAEETLTELSKKYEKEVSIHVYGQELNPEIFATCKSDLLLKGDGEEADNIKYGSTLSHDAFPSFEFDFMLSNPPYGKSWKTDIERLGGKKEIKDQRFIIDSFDDPEYSLVTRSSDGQMMFLSNMISKMKHDTILGSRIAEVHNGSSLFTGDAGQGESNTRRWIITNDWLEVIIALPENMFYNTGIATYIWVLSNRKPKHRKGKIQLIDATEWYSPLRKNLGLKNCELTEKDIKKICDTYLNLRESEYSKIFSNEEFGYWKVTVERPLRLRVDLDKERRENFRKYYSQKNIDLVDFIDKIAKILGEGPFLDYNSFVTNIKKNAKKMSFKLLKKQLNIIKNNFTVRDENATPVIKKQTKIRINHDEERDSLYGLFTINDDQRHIFVEYESDTELRDIEKISLMEKGGLEEYFKREVLPYTPDAWIDKSKITIGYEILFAKYFYKYVPLRSISDILTEIQEIEKETEGILKKIQQGTE